MLKSLRRKIAVLFTSIASLALVSVPCYAEGTANAQVVAGFTTGKDDIIATLGSVGPIAVAIMVVLLAWKYGRKLFSMIAK